MNDRISRREFLKAVTRWGVLGSFLFFPSFSASCSFLNRKDHLIDRKKGSIFYAQKSLGYYFYIIQQEAMRREVERRGYKLYSSVSNLNTTQQVNQIKEAAKKKPVAIICNPVSSGQTFAEVLTDIKRRGIPVGIVDTPLTNGEVSITVSFDNFKGGQMAAEKLVSLLQEKYGEPRGTILNCYGDLNSYAWQLRKQGFESVIGKYKNIHLISIPTMGDITKMYDATYSTLQKYPHLDGIHAPSETPARGIYEALKSLNRLFPVEDKKHIFFVTIDGEPIAHQWIKEGILDASISQDPIAYSEICIDLLDSYILKDKPIPEENYRNEKYYFKEAEFRKTSVGPHLTIPPFEINDENVDDQRLWANIAHREWGISYI